MAIVCIHNALPRHNWFRESIIKKHGIPKYSLPSWLAPWQMVWLREMVISEWLCVTLVFGDSHTIFLMFYVPAWNQTIFPMLCSWCSGWMYWQNRPIWLQQHKEGDQCLKIVWREGVHHPLHPDMHTHTRMEVHTHTSPHINTHHAKPEPFN